MTVTCRSSVWDSFLVPTVLRSSRILRTSGEDGGTLGTQACGESGILLIAARNNHTVFQQYCSTDMKVRIRRIGIVC